MNEDIQRLYDEAAAAHQDGAKSSEIKEEILPAVIELLEGSDRNLEQEARDAIDATVDPQRRTRRRHLRDNLEDLLAAALEEDGAYVDPLLDLAYPLGTEDGQDKALRHWTPEDLRNVVLMAYRKGGEVMKAATELDSTVSQVENEIRTHRARDIGEWQTGGGA